ncbi:hypothetical protein AB0M34_00595 [Nocardia sp. NPDC050193]
MIEVDFEPGHFSSLPRGDSRLLAVGIRNLLRDGLISRRLSATVP